MKKNESITSKDFEMIDLESDDFEDDGYSDEMLEAVTEKALDWAEGYFQTEYFRKLPVDYQEYAEMIISSFAEFCYGYEMSVPEKWSVSDVEFCCLELFPRKISSDETFFRAVSPVLSGYFEFLQENKYNKRGRKLADRVKKIEKKIIRYSRDTSNWGIAKSLFAGLFSGGFKNSEEEGFIIDEDENSEMTHGKPLREKRKDKQLKKARKKSKKQRVRNKKKGKK